MFVRAQVLTANCALKEIICQGWHCQLRVYLTAVTAVTARSASHSALCATMAEEDGVDELILFLGSDRREASLPYC